MAKENSSEEVDIEELVDELGDPFSSDASSTSEEEEEEPLEVPSEEGEQEESPSPGDNPPAPQPENAPEVQELGAPKTWTSEAIQDWATIPPRIKQEIHKREQDFFNGIEQYKTAAQRGAAYDSAVEPYRALLSAHGVDPVLMLKNFADNHYILSQGSPQDKLILAGKLLTQYRIDPVALAQHLSAEPTPNGTVDPNVTYLLDRVQGLESQLSQTSQNQHAAALEAAHNEIDEFKKTHEFFDEVAQDMQALFENKAASTLQEAYEIAVYRNPTTRAKELARLTLPVVPPTPPVVDKKKKALAANVNSDPKPRNGTVPKGSMDETMNDVYEDIASRDE